MSYMLINRDDMHLDCHFQSLELLQPEHLERPYVVINLDADLIEEFAAHKFSLLEMQLLYHNLGSVVRTDVKSKGSLITAIRRLVHFRLLTVPASKTLFPPKTVASIHCVRPDRPAAKVLPLAKPPANGNRLVIWKVADAMWEAAGKPLDVPTVLTLRKQIMVALETEHGVKRTTSSTALGLWQKERLA